MLTSLSRTLRRSTSTNIRECLIRCSFIRSSRRVAAKHIVLSSEHQGLLRESQGGLCWGSGCLGFPRTGGLWLAVCAWASRDLLLLRFLFDLMLPSTAWQYVWFVSPFPSSSLESCAWTCPGCSVYKFVMFHLNPVTRQVVLVTWTFFSSWPRSGRKSSRRVGKLRRGLSDSPQVTKLVTGTERARRLIFAILNVRL